MPVSERLSVLTVLQGLGAAFKSGRPRAGAELASELSSLGQSIGLDHVCAAGWDNLVALLGARSIRTATIAARVVGQLAFDGDVRASDRLLKAGGITPLLAMLPSAEKSQAFDAKVKALEAMNALRNVRAHVDLLITRARPLARTPPSTLTPLRAAPQLSANDAISDMIREAGAIPLIANLLTNRKAGGAYSELAVAAASILHNLANVSGTGSNAPSRIARPRPPDQRSLCAQRSCSSKAAIRDASAIPLLVALASGGWDQPCTGVAV